MKKSMKIAVTAASILGAVLMTTGAILCVFVSLTIVGIALVTTVPSKAETIPVGISSSGDTIFRGLQPPYNDLRAVVAHER